MRALLDVNVLVALAWPNHVHHSLARAWFDQQASSGWATCPSTESGFVRVSSNPVLPHAAVPRDALRVLARLRDLEGHEFLDDDTSLAVSPHVDRDRIHSHRFVADAHLLAVARRHRATLTTLDRGLQRTLGRGDEDPSVAMIGPDI